MGGVAGRSILIVEDEMLLAMDIELNAQGMGIWLDTLEPQ